MIAQHFILQAVEDVSKGRIDAGELLTQLKTLKAQDRKQQVWNFSLVGMVCLAKDDAVILRVIMKGLLSFSEYISACGLMKYAC